MLMTLAISSAAFPAGGAIPAVHTADGVGSSPPLEWSGAPVGTRSLVVIVDEPDAPGGTWVHWLLYDLPADATGLPEGVAPDALPVGTREGRNGWDATGYGGPAPPSGRHRYVFKLVALDCELGDLGEPTVADLVAAMDGHILAFASLLGTYARTA
jgi:Raf kinase inhibitor-like YbhB/YbcL family protein